MTRIDSDLEFIMHDQTRTRIRHPLESAPEMTSDDYRALYEDIPRAHISTVDQAIKLETILCNYYQKTGTFIQSYAFIAEAAIEKDPVKAEAEFSRIMSRHQKYFNRGFADYISMEERQVKDFFLGYDNEIASFLERNPYFTMQWGLPIFQNSKNPVTRKMALEFYDKHGEKGLVAMLRAAVEIADRDNSGKEVDPIKLMKLAQFHVRKSYLTRDIVLMTALIGGIAAVVTAELHIINK